MLQAAPAHGIRRVIKIIKCSAGKRNRKSAGKKTAGKMLQLHHCTALHCTASGTCTLASNNTVLGTCPGARCPLSGHFFFAQVLSTNLTQATTMFL